MNQYKIAVIPGDNIGPEVTAEALRVLREFENAHVCSFDFTTFPWGARHVLTSGRAAPENVAELLAPFDAILMGAHGDPANVPDRFSSQQLMHPIRKGLDLYANIRPVKWWPGTQIPLKQTDPIDFVMVRENTEGEYSNTGGSVHAGTPDEVAMMTTVVTRRGAERIIRHAFEVARKRNGKKYVHCVTKSNALAYVMVLWDKVFEEVAARYPDVRTTKAHVDATSMYIITRPSSFDVVVATNLMGDIISDEASAATGSIGLAPSANVNPERRKPAMFEPIHGSAPDIAGQQRANPTAAILAAAMMLDWLGESEAAKAIERSVGHVLEARRSVTPDLGGTARTSELTDAVLTELGLTLRA
jgi:tartrate dehydrogenase/decarboxylase / D-malate dehydrogenase